MSTSSCINHKYRKARKDHKCTPCGASIDKDTRYLYVSGIWDGNPQSFKVCGNCEIVFDNYLELDKYLTSDDGPSLDRGGVSEFLQGFLCQSYRGIEAAEDMAKTLGAPLDYIKRMIGVKRCLKNG